MNILFIENYSFNIINNINNHSYNNNKYMEYKAALFDKSITTTSPPISSLSPTTTTTTTTTTTNSFNNNNSFNKSIYYNSHNSNFSNNSNNNLEPPAIGTRIPYAYLSINPVKAISINNNSPTKSPIKIAIVLHCKILTSLYKSHSISRDLLEEHLSYLFDRIWVDYNLRVIEDVPSEKVSPLPKSFNKELFLQDTKTLAYLQRHPNYISNLNNGCFEIKRSKSNNNMDSNSNNKYSVSNSISKKKRRFDE